MIKNFAQFGVNEGYREVDEMRDLVNDILQFYATENAPLVNRVRRKAAEFMYFNHDGVFIREMTEPGKYTLLRDFIENAEVKFWFWDNISMGGIYAGKTKEITINHPHRDFLSMLTYNMQSVADANYGGDMSLGFERDECTRILRTTMGVCYRSIILHELQHAYDDFVSKGRYRSDKRSRQYYKKLNFDVYDKTSKMTPQEEHVYMSLPHEYWARFAQIVLDIPFHKPFADVAAFFKKNFLGYNDVNKDGQQRLYRALYKLYSLKKKPADIPYPTRQRRERIDKIKKDSGLQK